MTFLFSAGKPVQVVIIIECTVVHCACIINLHSFCSFLVFSRSHRGASAFSRHTKVSNMCNLVYLHSFYNVSFIQSSCLSLMLFVTLFGVVFIVCVGKIIYK